MPIPNGPRIIGITMTASDIEALRAFYEGVFGIEFLSEDHGDGVHYHATGGAFSFPDGFFLFTLERASDRWPSSLAQLAMFVSDVDAVHERAVAAGGESLEAPFDSDAFPRSAIIADPAGNNVQIYQNG